MLRTIAISKISINDDGIDETKIFNRSRGSGERLPRASADTLRGGGCGVARDESSAACCSRLERAGVAGTRGSEKERDRERELGERQEGEEESYVRDTHTHTRTHTVAVRRDDEQAATATVRGTVAVARGVNTSVRGTPG